MNESNNNSETNNFQKKSSPKSWPELIYKLRFFIVVFLLAICAITIFSSEKIEVETQTGTIVVNSKGQRDAIFTLSASGTRDQSEPWTETGVIVDRNDIIEITASGRVHTALHKLIKIAQTDLKVEPSWVSPDGSTTDQESDWDKIRNDKKVLPDKGGAHYGYGMLLAAIRDSKNQVNRSEIQPIGSKGEFKAQRDGRLVLAINDILLDENAEETYVLPISKYPEYYEDKLINDPLLKDLRDSNFSKDKKFEAIRDRRKKSWSNIKETNNYMVWFDDNIGSFSISISVK